MCTCLGVQVCLCVFVCVLCVRVIEECCKCNRAEGKMMHREVLEGGKTHKACRRLEKERLPFEPFLSLEEGWSLCGFYIS